MSIATEISRLQGAKADIKTAIEGKGVSVPSSALLDSYPDYIDAIQQGGGGEEHTYTGHVDTAGLTALGWDAEDIQWLQDHVWWDAEDDAYWAVTEANLAFGPNGATPLTWANRASVRDNPDVRYFPKFNPSPSSPTSWKNLFNQYVFLYAIPTHGWDTRAVTAFTSMFGGCFQLVSVGDLSGWDTSVVSSFASMFQNCYQLVSVGDLSNWDTHSVTNMSYMFNNCNRLEAVGDLSNWDTSAVTTFTAMFAAATRLISIGNLSSWDTHSATGINNLFQNCYQLVSVGDLSNWDTHSVTNMLYTFGYIRSIRKLDLTGWDTSACTNVGTSAVASIFAGAYGVYSLRLGAKFFNFSPSAIYLNHLYAWTRDSIYESLYTNQTLRDSSSPAKSVHLYSKCYDQLSQQDLDDIATKNITLIRD